MAIRPPDDIHVAWRDWPHARLWYRKETDRGEVTEFAVQLEYNHLEISKRFDPHVEPNWRPVARLDHSFVDHDWRSEPPHVDIYEDGQKIAVFDDFGMVDPNKGIDFSITFLHENKQALLLAYTESAGFARTIQDESASSKRR